MVRIHEILYVSILFFFHAAAEMRYLFIRLVARDGPPNKKKQKKAKQNNSAAHSKNDKHLNKTNRKKKNVNNANASERERARSHKDTKMP